MSSFRSLSITGPAIADTYLNTVYFPGISDEYVLEVRRERGIETRSEYGLAIDFICKDRIL